MAILNKVQRGQPISSDLINNIIDSIRECQLQSVVGGFFRRGPGGTTITLQPSRGGASSQICPFDPTVTAVSSGYEISFSVGTINGILPTNMFSSFPITSNTLNYYYLTCASDGKIVTGAEIDYNISPPTIYTGTPDSAPLAFSRLIAVVITSGIAVRTITCDNLIARVVATVQEDNVTYVAGQRNFIQYYGWA
jgi:hypothetical protein